MNPIDSSRIIVARKIAPLIACAASVILVYLYLATGGFKSVGFPNHELNGYYDRLAAAFLRGETFIAREPAEITTWDMSLFEGRYYLYFGPVPAVLLYLPVSLLSSGRLGLHDSLAVFIFCAGTFSLSVLLLVRSANCFSPAPPTWLLVFATFMIGFGNTSSALLGHPRTYEVAVASATFFVLAAITIFGGCLLRVHHDRTLGHSFAGISIALVLAIGSKPTALVAAAVVTLGVLFVFRRRLAERPKLAAWLVLPLLVGGGLLACYNYARFGSVSEFGLRYQQNSLFMEMFTLSPKYADHGLYYYILHPPKLTWHFPFLSVTEVPSNNIADHPYFQEYPLGILFSAPLIIAVPLLLGGLQLTRRSLGATHPRRVQVLLAVLGVSALGTLLLLSCFPSITYRFPYEFAAPAATAMVIGWIALEQDLQGRNRGLRIAVHFVILCCGVVGTYVNLFVVPYFH